MPVDVSKGDPLSVGMGMFQRIPNQCNVSKTSALYKFQPSPSPAAENVSDQIPSRLSPAGEVCSAAHSPHTGPSVKRNKASTIYLLWDASSLLLPQGPRAGPSVPLCLCTGYEGLESRRVIFQSSVWE